MAWAPSESWLISFREEPSEVCRRHQRLPAGLFIELIFLPAVRGLSSFGRVCVCARACVPDTKVYFWGSVLPHGSVNDLHDALVDALADVDQWRSTFAHLPQQQTWGQAAQSCGPLRQQAWLFEKGGYWFRNFVSSSPGHFDRKSIPLDNYFLTSWH